jgi:hypothetical protein
MSEETAVVIFISLASLASMLELFFSSSLRLGQNKLDCLILASILDYFIICRADKEPTLQRKLEDFKLR